jgi:disulfide bond formation protein DsbB
VVDLTRAMSMPLRTLSDPPLSAAYRLGQGVLALTGGVILVALGFQYVGGYAPCELCLAERYVYYAVLPVLFVALALLAGARRAFATALFLLVALAFLFGAGLGAYHAGVEWNFWPGPAACTAGPGTVSTDAGALFSGLEKVRVPRCDVAPWHFLGLSFAGWNVVASLALACGALATALRVVRHG